MGGLPLSGPGATACGVLYRGDAPYADDVQPIDFGGPAPAVVVDLRGERERRRRAYAWPAGTTVHPVPMLDAAAPGAARADLGPILLRILDGGALWAGPLLRAVTGHEGPALVYCTAGKDRTGVAAAALLLAAGVRPSAVIDDFVRSEAAVPALQRRWLETGVRRADAPPLPEQYLRAPAEAIEPVVERLTAGGGAAEWFAEHGAEAADIERWRRRIRADSDGRDEAWTRRGRTQNTVLRTSI